MDDLDDFYARHRGAPPAASQYRIVDHDLSMRRVRERIDRALDCGNHRQFIELCRLLRDYQAQGSRAPDTP
jgi:hypothetical protein